MILDFLTAEAQSGLSLSQKNRKERSVILSSFKPVIDKGHRTSEMSEVDMKIQVEHLPVFLTESPLDISIEKQPSSKRELVKPENKGMIEVLDE